MPGGSTKACPGPAKTTPSAALGLPGPRTGPPGTLGGVKRRVLRGNKKGRHGKKPAHTNQSSEPTAKEKEENATSSSFSNALPLAPGVGGFSVVLCFHYQICSDLYYVIKIVRVIGCCFGATLDLVVVSIQ